MNLTEWITKEDLSIKEFAEEFVNVVKENFGEHNYKCVTDIVNKHLANGADTRTELSLPIQSVMGWLSAEKKPTDEHDVLICTTDNYIGIGWYYDDSKEWAFEVNKNTAIHSGIVAYWMEIPACP
jgi:hypothetical protein